MTERRTPEQQAQDFVNANYVSPVVAGRAIEHDPGKPGKGGVYTLRDGTSHRLDLAACRLLPEGYPRWAIQQEDSDD